MPDLPPTSFQPPSDPGLTPPIEAGAVIAGRYKLLEEIGEGGMGTVFVAEQTEPVRRKVALKLIKPGMDSKTVLARFEAERQALAMMDHPNIAKVLDGGLTETGRPFFVMEYVKGVPITEYCDATRLSVSERLQLFVSVCQAVQHAHQKGVIHRDLKPSNILVAPYDGRPVPKVIDFGLAKAMYQSLTERTLHTAHDTVLGTPRYMSPEQAQLNNLDVDTRSDIYSLGVLLYELLTGTTPLDAQRYKEAAWDEVRRIIREEEPPRPSTRLSSANTLPSLAASRHTEPAGLTKLVRGELDWIAMKALEKDRNRRYETANGFAMDVQRYLAGEAVLAVPPSASYRLRKFVRKHRGPVIAASLVSFAILGGLVATSFGFYQAHMQRHRAEGAEGVAVANFLAAVDAADAERQAKLREAAQVVIAQQKEKEALEEKTKAIAQRERAEKARDRTRDVLDAMTSEVTGDSLATQKTITEEQKKFLTEVLTYYKEFAGEKADDERSRERTASAALQVGLIEDRLGHSKESEAALRMAREGYAALAADFPTVPLYGQQLGRSHWKLGTVLIQLAKLTEAEGDLRRAQVVQEKLAADFPAVPVYRLQLSYSHNNLGNVLIGLGKRPQAETEYRKAVAINEKLAADFPTKPLYRHGLAGSYYNVGLVLNDLGKWSEAETEYRKSISILEKLTTEFPSAREYRQALANSYTNLGISLRGLEMGIEAEGEYRKALAIQLKLVADFPSVPVFRQELAQSHGNLGIVLNGLVKHEQSEGEYRKALAVLQTLVTDFPTVPKYRLDLARIHLNLGIVLKDLVKREDAEGEYRNAVAILEKLAADSPTVPVHRRDLATSYYLLGSLFTGFGKREQAETEYRKALSIQEKLLADFPSVFGYRKALATTCYSFACLYGITSGKVVEKNQEFADRAMEMLHKAVKAGYTDAARMAKDTDLDPLRDRADFKKLLDSLPKLKSKEKEREAAPPPRAVP